MVHLRSCHALETRTGGETSNFRGKLGNWGSSRFSSGVITDADPSARHAPLLLIRSHHNVSSLSLSLWSMTLCPPLKAWNLRQKAWTAQLIHSTSVLLNYATKNGQVGAMKVEQVKIISGHTGTIKELQTKTWLKTGRNLNLPGQFHLWFWPFWNEHHRATFNHRFTNVLYSISRWKNCWHCHLQSDFEMV